MNYEKSSAIANEFAKKHLQLCEPDYGSATRVACAREKQVASFFRLNGRQRSDARNDTPSKSASAPVS
jgi:hypothetical protein